MIKFWQHRNLFLIFSVFIYLFAWFFSILFARGSEFVGMVSVLPIVVLAWFFSLRMAAVATAIAFVINTLGLWLLAHHELSFQITGALSVGSIMGHILTFLIVLFLHKLKREISLRKESEEGLRQKINELEQKDKLLMVQTRQAKMGELLSMIAHQWRQPLTSMGITAATIKMKLSLPNSDMHQPIEMLDNLEKKIHFLSDTIDDFRKFYLTDKEKKEINIIAAIQDALVLLQLTGEKRGLKITENYQTEQTIFSYKNELIQVFLNLIKNAEDVLTDRKTPEPQIQIETYAEDAWVVIEISDNAGGISADVMENLFTPYFSTKDEKNGTGLGLYMSKIIVEKHCGGQLEVKNTDKGARFIIRLPLAAPDR